MKKFILEAISVLCTFQHQVGICVFFCCLIMWHKIVINCYFTHSYLIEVTLSTFENVTRNAFKVTLMYK